MARHRADRSTRSWSSWPVGIAGVGVLVMSSAGVISPYGHAPSRTSPRGTVAGEALPSERVLLSRPSPVLWPPPTSHGVSLGTSPLGFYQRVRRMWTSDALRPPVFHRLLSQPSAPPTPRSSARVRVQHLHLFPGLRLRLRRSALPCPLRAHSTTLQGSLHVTDCWVAPLSQGDTPLHHIQSPRCSGSLLRGALALTTTGLAPVSRR